MPKVLFCIPPFPGVYGWPGQPHAGVGWLEASLEASGVAVSVVDLRLGGGVRRLLRAAAAFRPDYVGVTVMTYKHREAYRIVRRLKAAGYRVVVGGPHVSTVGRDAVDGSGADFGVIGEGEAALGELVRGEGPPAIAGLIYRAGGEVIANPRRPWLKDLDALRWPRYRAFPLAKYGSNVMAIVSSRGCPYECIYCPVQVTMGRQYRARAPEGIVEEIGYWYGRGWRHFEFVDDNFTLDRKRVFDLCGLLDRANIKARFDLRNGARADCLDRELLSRMKSVGFKYIAFGVESANGRVLANIKKGQKLETVAAAVKTACELGYDVGLFFLVGSPGESVAEFEESLVFAKRYPVADAAFYNLVPFPGTALYDWVRKNGRLLTPPERYLNDTAHWQHDPIFETPDFLAAERRRCLAKGRRFNAQLQARYLKKRLARRFGPWAGIIYPVARCAYVKSLVLTLAPPRFKRALRSET